MQEHTAVAKVQFFRAFAPCSPLCLSCWAACFQTQWVHLSGRTQGGKSSLKSSQSQSRITRMKRRGRERMTTVWFQRMFKLAQFDSEMNQALTEMCVRGKCSYSQLRLLNVQPITDIGCVHAGQQWVTHHIKVQYCAKALNHPHVFRFYFQRARPCFLSGIEQYFRLPFKVVL